MSAMEKMFKSRTKKAKKRSKKRKLPQQTDLTPGGPKKIMRGKAPYKVS